MPTKPKETFVPTQQEQKAAVKLVGYELWMLRECAAMPKPKTQVEKNLWYEGLVLHSRVLRDFFFTKYKQDGKRDARDTDIVAVDYFAAASSWHYTSQNLPPYLKQTKDRMDQTLAHLTFGRLKYTGSAKAWSTDDLRAEIGETWIEFIEKLQGLNEPAADWFLAEARRRKIPTVAPF